MNTQIVRNRLFRHPTQDDSSYILCYTKIICFMLICTFKAKVATCKTIVYVIETLSEVVISTPIAIYKWFNKPQIQHIIFQVFILVAIEIMAQDCALSLFTII